MAYLDDEVKELVGDKIYLTLKHFTPKPVKWTIKVKSFQG